MAKSRVNSPFTLAIPDSPPQEMKDPVVYAEFQAMYNAMLSLQQAFTDFCGIVAQFQDDWPQVTIAQTIYPQNCNRLYLQASEDISAGAMCNIHNSGGQKIRNANASNTTKPCFAYAPNGILNANFGEVYVMQGLASGFSGLTIGSIYYLNTVNGDKTLVAPAGSGQIIQPVGFALSTTDLYFNPELLFTVNP